MSATGSPQVYIETIETVQRSLLRMNFGGAAGTTAKKVVDEVQGFLNSRFPELGILFDRDGANVVEGEHAPSRCEEERRVLSTSKENDQTPLPGHFPSGGPDIEMTNSTPDGLYQQLPPSDTTDDEPGSLIATLKSRVHELTEENAKLKNKLEQTVQEKTGLDSMLKKATQERDDLGRQRQASQLKIRKLNDLIIKNSQNSDEPLDGEVLQDMFKVRNMTTDVIKKFYPGEVKYHPEVAKELTKRLQTPFYSQFYKYQMFPDKGPERRRRLLISLLFKELQYLFFGADARRFGLPRDMEKSFQVFEKEIEGSIKVDAEETLDWRTRTVSYAVRLDLDYRETIGIWVNRFLAILEPVLLQPDKYGNQDQRERVGLSNALHDLCSAALKLALRFRSSKTKYEFKTYQDNTSLAACNEELVKKLNSEGPISKPMDPEKLQIFCTLFGALVKTRPSVSGEPSDPIVLEVGHVIVHEPQLRAQPQ